MSCDRAVALFGLVVPLALAAEPGQHLAVALDRGRQSPRGVSMTERMASADSHGLNSSKLRLKLVAEAACWPRRRASASASSGVIGVQPTSAACFTIGNWTVPASLILRSLMRHLRQWLEERPTGRGRRRGFRRSSAHVSKVLNSSSRTRASLVELDLLVDCIENRDDLVCLVGI